MRVIFWCDMEGIAGITKWEQVNSDQPMYQEGRMLYTNEINACVRASKKAGAKEIIVVDGHGAGGGYTFQSFILDKLERGAQYVFGHRWGCYIEPLKSGCDAMLMPGAHAKSGTPDGVLSHTMSSERWYNCYINNQLVGESALVAGIAGTFNVPCVFVSGDEATCKDVKNLIGPDIVTCPIKKGLGRYAVRTLHPADACDLIEKKVYEALTKKKWPKPLKFKSPVTIKVEVTTPDRTDTFRGRTGVKIIGNRTIISKGKSFLQAWDQLWYRG